MCCFIIGILTLAISKGSVKGEYSIVRSSTAIPYYYSIFPYKRAIYYLTVLNRVGFNLNYEEAETISNYSLNINYPLTEINRTDSIPNYNIILIAIDSWNPRTFNPDNTPNIVDFSKISNTSSKHLSSGNHTLSSIFSIFTGLVPSYAKSFTNKKESPVLIDELIERNYEIKVFPSAHFGYAPWNFNEIIFHRVPDINIGGEGPAYERDVEITNNFVDFVDQNKDTNKPFFAFLFYDLPHDISLPSELNTKYQTSLNTPDYLALNNDYDPTNFYNLYRNCVFVTDSLVGQVLDKIKESNLLDNSVIIITGDHSQEFNENKKNYWGHGSNFSKWQIQIPFTIYYPHMENLGGIINHTTTHYDISNTLAKRFFGVTNPASDFSFGLDLWDSRGRLPHLVNSGTGTNGVVFENYIYSQNINGVIEVTDLELNQVDLKDIDKKELNEVILKRNRFSK